MNRNDQISIAWHEAALRARQSVPDPTVPAVSRSDLCARCASIDLPTILQQPVEDDQGIFVASLGSRDELKASVCSLCRLFGSVAPSDLKKPFDGNCQLRAFSAAKVQRTDRLSSVSGISRLDVTLLAVVHCGDRKEVPTFYRMEPDLEKTGYICPIQNDRSPPYFGVRILAEEVDVDFVKRCISHCQENHDLDAACRVNNRRMKRAEEAKQRDHMHQNTGIDGQQDTLDSSLSARFFRLIDCSKRAVVEAPPESPYVALSYVWGASKHDSPSVPDAELQWPSALEKLPRTIDDCIQATLSFGIRYLWIDRYCINQADPEAKMNQVSRMDMIYANATLTIIAAAGNGPDFGLPGVNKTKRSSQPSLRIGDITLASTLPSPRSSLQGSTWASRGWTYQEGLLSKRRLIFTHQQTYFECNGMHIGEAASMPVDVVHLRQDDEDGDMTAGAFNFNNPGSSPIHLKHFIAEYTGKDLRYPQDILNAMKGIFAHFGKLDQPVDHLMGIPLVPSVAEKTYLPTNCFLAGLCWQLESPAARRAGFPSWTWAGWLGKLEPRWLPSLYTSTILGRDIRVTLEHLDGSLWCLPTEQSTSRPYSQQLAGLNISFIHIEAKTFALQLILLPSYTAQIDLGDLGIIYYQFNADRAFHRLGEDAFPKDLTAILIGDLAGGNLRDTMILCVEQKVSFAERVGTVSLPWLPLRDFDQGIENSATLDQFATFLQRQPMRTIRLG